ncbi:MAG: trigger factor [Candidatus Paceibacterota bacterium]
MEPKTANPASVKKLDKSRVEITSSIPVEIWEKSRKQAIKHINESITLDGFRKGNIPENILVAKVGNMAILEEMAELALPKAYVDILVSEKIDAIGKPEIHVTKLAEGNPLEFKAITAVVPEVTLPDYRKLAAKEISKQNPEEEKVTDKDIEDAITRIRRSRASHEGHDHAKMTPEEHEKAIHAAMPELTDDFVKTLGDFKDVTDFKNKLEALVAEEKKASFREKRRLKIAEVIASATKAELPDIMIESEIGRTEAQFRADIERMGVKLDDYLKHAKKTIEDIRKEWLPDAEKKAKLQLVLNEIAKKENIKPDAAEIEAEVNHIVAHYKDADRERAAIYAETVLTNDKVFVWLEGQK